MKIKKLNIGFISAGGGDIVYTKKNIEGIITQKVSPYFSLFQNLGDDVKVQAGEEKTEILRKYECAIFPSNQVQICKRVRPMQPFHEAIQWLYFDVIVNDVYRIDDLFSFPIKIPEQYTELLYTYIKEMINYGDGEQTLCDRLSIAYKIIKILLSIAEEKPKVDNDVFCAINYIKKNYHQAITVSDLAKEANLSESHFFRRFKRQTGKSPIAYINDYRLIMGSMLLQNTNMRISAVSAKTGFKEAYYFSKQFIKKFGVSPTAYRKMYL